MYARIRNPLMRFLSLALALSVLFSVSVPALAEEVDEDGGTNAEIVTVDSPEALIAAVNGASGDIIIDLTEDITISANTSFTNVVDGTITLTSSSGKSLILDAYIQIGTHMAFRDLTILLNNSRTACVRTAANGILDVYNSNITTSGMATYGLLLATDDSVVNFYSGTISETTTMTLALTKGTLNFFPTGNIEIGGKITQQRNAINIYFKAQPDYNIQSAIFNGEEITKQMDEGYSTGVQTGTVNFSGLSIKLEGTEDEPEPLPPTEYTIDTSAVAFFSALTIDGNEASDEAKATEGQEVKITLAVPSGYEVTSYNCTDESGQDVAVELSNNVLTFTMPASGVTVSAQVNEKDKFTLTRKVITDGVEGNFSGLILGVGNGFYVNSVSGADTAYENDSVEFGYVLANGYYVSGLSYTVEGGETVDLMNSVTSSSVTGQVRYRAPFTMPAGNVTVTLELTNSAQRRVVCQPCEGGSISVDKELVTNDTINVFPVPEEGYRVSSVEYSLDGGEIWQPVWYGYPGDGVREFHFTPSGTTDTTAIQVRASFSNNTELSIDSEQDLRDFAQAVNQGDWFEGVTVTLERDIELHGTWTPIGNYTGDMSTYGLYFAGTFEGSGHTVSGLTLDPTAVTMGFFGNVFEATIRDLTVEGEITAVGDVDERYIGGIVAFMHSYDQMNEISNCVSRVDIKLDLGSAEAVGGIVGMAYSAAISDCTNWGDIDAVFSYNGGNIIRAKYLGGIVGYTLYYTNLISRCANYGNMTCDAGEFSTTSSTSGVTVGDRWASGAWGGIIGHNGATGALTLDSCINKGSIVGDMQSFGGLVAHTAVSNQYLPVTIQNCYNAGLLQTFGDHNATGIGGSMGGIFAQVDGQSLIQNSYSSGLTLVEVPPVDGRGTYAGELWSTRSNPPRKENSYGPSDIAKLEGGLTPTDLNPSGATVLRNGGQVPIWKEDLATDANGNSVHINGGTPMLYWESALFSGETSTVNFATTPAGASVALYASSNMDESSRQMPNAGGSYTLYDGLTYYYKVSAQGYAATTGSFTVNGSTTVAVELKTASVVTFKLTPSTATMTVTGGSDVAYDSRTVVGDTVEYAYTLVNGTHYIYSVDADGYAGTTREFTASGSATITLALEKSNYGTGDAVKYIYGDGNPGEEHEITSAGTYSIGDGATGTITINANGVVTLIGRGVNMNNVFENLYLDCAAGTNLILEQVYISNSIGTASMIDFTGSGNYLTFSGTNILDQNTGATGYAMIHVDPDTSLTLKSKNGGTAYLYKREQGAAIGGHGSGGRLSPEYNGDITIDGLDLFIKGSKQGALIGGGAGVGSSGSPGRIVIEGGSDLNLICNAQGAAIGSGSGNANSIGPDVTVRDSMININVNFDAAAIGGGGFKANKDDDVGSNESDGGTLTYEGNSSIRAYIDRNGMASWGVVKEGVNGNKAVTANVINSSGQQLCLLELDTTSLSGYSFSINEGNKTVYSGGLHQWGYVNEDLTQGGEGDVTYTIDNWVPSNDPHLYLYLTPGEHKLTTRTETIDVSWNSSANVFEYIIKNTATGEVIATGSGFSAEEADIKFIATTTENNTATTTVNSELLAETLKDAGASTQIVVPTVIEEGETITQAVTVLTRSDVSTIADAKASLKISTPLADIVLSNTALQNVAGSDQKAEQVTITAAAQANGTRIEVAVDDNVLDKVDGGLKVTLPVTEEALSARSVMVLVDSEGNETVIRKSALDEVGVTALLDGSCTVKAVNNAAGFSDTAEHWASSFIDFVSSRELFTGTAPGIFEPEGEMTRAMLVTVLHRLEDTPDTAMTEAFGDVPSGSWYTDSVHWANENGIVYGMGDGVFAPDDSITREQMVVMMYRYCGFLDWDVSERDDLGSFSDTSEISDWATEAIQWAVNASLLEGKETGALDPQGTATRAEVAAILQRLISLLVK